MCQLPDSLPRNCTKNTTKNLVDPYRALEAAWEEDEAKRQEQQLAVARMALRDRHRYFNPWQWLRDRVRWFRWFTWN